MWKFRRVKEVDGAEDEEDAVVTRSYGAGVDPSECPTLRQGS